MSKLSKVLQGYEDLTEPPASQSNVSIAKMLYLAPLLPVLYGLYLYGANTLLPPDDAARVKELVEVMVQVVGGVIGGGAPLALMYRSLKLTGKKLENQERAELQGKAIAPGLQPLAPWPSPQVSTVDTSQYSEPLESVELQGGLTIDDSLIPAEGDPNEFAVMEQERAFNANYQS